MTNSAALLEPVKRKQETCSTGEGELFYAAMEDHQRLGHMAEGDVMRAVSTLRGEVKLRHWAHEPPHRAGLVKDQSCSMHTNYVMLVCSLRN